MSAKLVLRTCLQTSAEASFFLKAWPDDHRYHRQEQRHPAVLLFVHWWAFLPAGRWWFEATGVRRLWIVRVLRKTFNSRSDSSVPVWGSGEVLSTMPRLQTAPMVDKDTVVARQGPCVCFLLCLLDHHRRGPSICRKSRAGRRSSSEC